MRLVEPNDDVPDPRAELRQALRSSPTLANDAEALARIFSAYSAIYPDEATAITKLMTLARSAFERHPGAAILGLLARLSEQHEGPRGPTRAHTRQWARRRMSVMRPLVRAWLAGQTVDLTSAVVSVRLRPDEECPVFLGLVVRHLLNLRCLDLSRVLMEDVVRAAARMQISVPDDLLEKGRLEPWLWLVGPRALAAAQALVERVSEDALGATLSAVVTAISRWSNLAFNAHPANPAPVWGRCAPHFARLVRHLLGRLNLHRDDLEFLGALWWASWRVIEDRPDLADPELVRAARETATRALGRLRPLLRDARRDGAAEEFGKGFLHYTEAVRLLVHSEGLWAGMKPLLLALAALSTRAVATDLRYWDEVHLEQTPKPWVSLPSLLAGIVHAFSHAEEAKDSELRRLREDFAEFCLDRLKTRDKKLLEPSVAWRECCVRAFRELRVNPRGTGHHVLHRASLEDPDDDVRAAAATAYQETRQGVLLPPGSSPRRAIFAAYWWLRQAHLLALGSTVDPQGAQRTRQKEIRRTKEAEEHEKAAS